ncbi:MAG: rod shape-determining protein MreC [Bacteroidetes bacterium]|nr:MAG: rod shape-determining protein MreC [Bacteroidota bacterium]
MIRLWNKVRDWVLLLVLLLISISVLLSVNDPMVRGLRARALETTSSVEGWFSWLGNYYRAADENEALRNENHRLSSDLARAREASAVNDELREMLNLPLVEEYDVVAATIIYKDITRERNFMTIDIGSEHGISENMAVIDTRGILGKTVDVGARVSRVMTYLNGDFSIPVKISGSNSDGILRWDGDAFDRLAVDFVPLSQEINVSDMIVTSGYSGIFQPGLPVGVITQFSERPGLITWEISVRPFARLDNAQYVFVIRSVPIPDIMTSESVQ